MSSSSRSGAGMGTENLYSWREYMVPTAKVVVVSRCLIEGVDSVIETGGAVTDGQRKTMCWHRCKVP